MNVKEMRKAKNLTQMQLSELSGVSQQLISAIESGKVTNPTYQTVEKLKAVLGNKIVKGGEKVDRKKDIESIRNLF
jgi:transcriptional regulator with XRE-family HTH domain